MTRSTMTSRARRIVVGAAALLLWVSDGAGQTPNRPDNGALMPGGIIVTSPYPSWFVSRENAGDDELVFRKFSYEGIARNIFVLSCRRDPGKPVLVEFIPPKSLEAVLRARASDELKPVGIILDESAPAPGKDLIAYRGRSTASPHSSIWSRTIT
jgi:hypothetical protein